MPRSLERGLASLYLHSTQPVIRPVAETASTGDADPSGKAQSRFSIVVATLCWRLLNSNHVRQVLRVWKKEVPIGEIPLSLSAKEEFVI